MTWPQFLNPMIAIIAAAVAIPLLVLLYFLKLRRQERVISSTILWRKAIQDLQVNAPFQKLRRNLLLFLQLLLLILLALALSRPVVQHTPGAGQVSVILIDHSASMSAKDVNGKSRLEEAKRQATDLVNSMRRGSQAMVIAFDETAQTVESFTTDTAALRRAIDSIEPTDRNTRLKLAFTLADAQLAFIPEQNRPNVAPPDVWLYSDGRVQDNTEELTLRGNLKYVKIGADDSTNIAIVALSARRNFEKPTEVQVFSRLANYGPQFVNTDVQLSINGKMAKIASVQLPPERWHDPEWTKQHAQEIPPNYETRNSVEFTIDLPDAAVLTLEQLYKDDVLAADNTAQIIVPPARQLRMMMVTEGNYFLRRAIGALPLKDCQIIKPSDYEGKIPENMDLILFDRYQPKQLPAAGSFIYFAAVPPDSKLKAIEKDGNVVMLSSPEVTDWYREHPILEGVSMRAINILETMQLDVPLEAQVLVGSSRGPLIVLYREPRRTHLVVGFDVLQSDWAIPPRQSLPVFLFQTLRFMALSSQVNVRESLSPGDAPTIERALLNRVDPNLAQVKLSGPINRVLPIRPESDLVLPSLDRVGLYTLDPPIPGAEQLAVNLLSERESNIAPVATPPGQAGEVVTPASGKARLELWWWIVAAAALPLLLIEWLVYTRRVHL